MSKTSSFPLTDFNFPFGIGVLGFLILIGGVLSGCSTASLKTREYDESSGLYQEVKYTRHYQGEADLVPGKIRIQVQAAIENRYGKDAFITPKDQWAKADFTVYISNISQSKATINLRKILLMCEYFSDLYLADSQEVDLIPQAVEKLVFTSRQIDRNAKECILKIEFVYGGQKYSRDVTIRRLTVEEWKAVRPPLLNL